MTISESLLPEFDQEMAVTRRVLERVPDDKMDYQPHAKSMKMGQLASHIASLPGLAAMAMTTESLDLNPPGGEPVKPPLAATGHELMALHDECVAKARAAIAGASDDHLMKSWALLFGGNPVFAATRVSVVRGLLINHMIHHRGQLSVYLRLNDIPVPSIYGPSADEGTA